MTCSFAIWDTSLSESLLSNDGTKIFNLFTYGDGTTYYLYFATFKESDGTIDGSRYKSSTGCSKVFGSAQKEEFIVATVYCNPSFYLVIVNSTSSIFTFLKFSGQGLYGAAPQSNKLG